MLEKPNISDESILASLNEHYAIEATGVAFLPLGNSASAWVYRVEAADTRYFLKVHKGTPELPVLLVPRYLKDQAISQVVAPLVTRDGALWVETRGYSLTVYPFVVGKVGMEIGLSDAQWTVLGRVMKLIHSTRPQAEMAAQMRTEHFRLKWLPAIEQMKEKIAAGEFHDEYETALAAFWTEKATEIERIIARAMELGEAVREQALPYVLCHADIHTANILLTPEGDLQIVDWDGIMLAPKERDLMFSLEDVNGSKPFLKGYGEVEVNWQAIAYYRYEWVVQEMGDYGERVFLEPETGAETKDDAVRGFRQLFDPGDVVEMAYEVDKVLGKMDAEG